MIDINLTNVVTIALIALAAEAVSRMVIGAYAKRGMQR